MALTPEAVRLGVVFPSPSPFSRAQFETALRPLNGSVTDAVGARVTGEQVPIQLLQWPQGIIIYDSTLGVVSIDIRRIHDPVVVETTILNPLLVLAGVNISDLKSFEVESAFVMDTPSTALAALEPLAGRAPVWVETLMGAQMRGWGVRFVGVEATTMKAPFREATPWNELTIEPFGNNPKKAFVKFLVRHKAWSDMKKWLVDLPTKAEMVEKQLLQ